MAEQNIQHSEFQIPETIPGQLAVDYKYMPVNSVAVGHADPKVGQKVILLNFSRTAYLPIDVGGRPSIEVKQLVVGTIEIELAAARVMHELLGKAISAFPPPNSPETSDSSGS